MVLDPKTVWNVMALLLACSQTLSVRRLETVSRNHRAICVKNSQNWKLSRTYCLDKLNLFNNILIRVSKTICQVIHVTVKITVQYLGTWETLFSLNYCLPILLRPAQFSQSNILNQIRHTTFYVVKINTTNVIEVDATCGFWLSLLIETNDMFNSQFTLVLAIQITNFFYLVNFEA